MKMPELKKNVLVSCIIDFDDIQLCLRHFCLNLNICKDMNISKLNIVEIDNVAYKDHFSEFCHLN